MDLAAGTSVSRYRVIAPLGRGAGGAVYRAWDAKLDREVALKVLARDDAASAARFARGARAVAALTHPNAVVLYDAGEAGELLFLAMELLDGTTLGRTPGSIADRIGWLVDVARALHAAHTAGIVHRDVKPDNVMVTSTGQVKVLDFGIARRVHPGVASVTTKGTFVGTPAYASPEQIRGEPADALSDQWSWGVTAYEILAGCSPWKRGDDAMAAVAEILTSEPEALRSVSASASTSASADVPRAVAAVVARAMSKDRTRRFASMLEAAEALASSGAVATTGSARSRDIDPRAHTILDVAERALLSSTSEHGSWLREIARAPPRTVMPARLGSFRVAERLGAGGMGVVHRAVDERLHREVALKVLGDHGAGEVERRRFLREARTAAAVTHRSIATIYEVGEAEGRLFIAMELVRGPTLRHRMRARLAPDEALRIAREIAEGLARAHHARVVHRDLKPENVMLTPEGEVRILDFGLAKLGGDAADLPRSATESHAPGERRVVGTPAYMAPEQARGEEVDARADVFAFGVVLFEMLAGERPFEGATRVEIAARVAHDEAPRLRVRGLPSGLAELTARCLRKAPEDRPASGRQLVEALERIGAPGPRRRLWPIVGATIATAIALLGAAAWTTRAKPSSPPVVAEPRASTPG